MTSAWIDKIRSRLSHPLPGHEAHSLMMPRLASGKRLNLQPGGAPRKGAVLLLLYEKNGELYFPLIQRSVYPGVHSGQIAFPGGKHEEQDEDLYHTALREAYEEVGVEQQAVDIMGTLSEFFVSASNHLVLPVIGFYPSVPVFKPDPIEVDELIEAPLSELLNKKLRKSTEIVTPQGYKLVSPYFELRGKVVWGATAMMLSEFVEIIHEL